MLSDKAKKSLKARTSGRRGDSVMTKILDWLSSDDRRDTVWRINDLRRDVTTGSGTLYAAVYRLAIQDKIGFASSRYHVFKHSYDPSIRSMSAKRAGVLLWHRDLNVSAPLREEWIDQAVTGQLPLFDGGLESMSTDDLDKIIERAEYIKIKRGIDRRYACLSGGVREQLADVFKKIKITDPVYFAHSDESLSFLTYTAVPAMPIDIVVDVGDGAQRLNCHHLTIFGKAIVTATDNIFGKEPQ